MPSVGALPKKELAPRANAGGTAVFAGAQLNKAQPRE